MAKLLRLTLLGESSISLDGEPVDLPLTKAQGLLFYLAVTGRTVPRSTLVDLFWSELAPDDARRNLRVALTKLRQVGGDHLQTTRTAVTFKQDANCWLDVREFVQLSQAAAQPSDPLLPTAQATDRAAALTLYRGDFLSGFAVANAPVFEEWMLLERERLRRLALQVGDTLLAHYWASGESAAGIELGRRLLALEPWHEGLHRRLMQLLAQSGQRAAALQQYESCRRVLAEELGVEPEGTTRALYEQIRRGVVERSEDQKQTPQPVFFPSPHRPTASALPRHNLPAQTTPFVGRAGELAQIANLLADPGCRLLTLLGVGGIGKTRLALQTAQQQLSEGAGAWADGLFFVSLAAVPTMAEAIPAIAGALGLTFAGSSEPKMQLLDFLRAKKLLLFLDNFEHLAAEAVFLSELLQAAPGLKLLVTSRTRLDLYEEWLFDVGGLPFPPPTPALTPGLNSQGADKPIEAYEAVQLFAQRARRIRLDFDLAAESEAVRTVCQLLEGMPLGIELAAGWVRSYPCATIAVAIKRSLDFLATSARNVPDRHRSLRAAFDHSWRFLAPADAMLFKRLVVFQGGFDERAAAAVASATPLALARLADKSLLQGMPDGRYLIHELLRQYGLEKLNAAEQHLLQAAHCRYYGGIVAGQQPHRETAAEPQAHARLRTEYDNIRAGWQWLVEQIGALAQEERPGDWEQLVQLVEQYAPILAHFLLRECRYREGKQMFTAAAEAMIDAGWVDDRLALAGRSPQATLALTHSLLADFAFNLSQFGEVEALIRPALAPLKAAGQDTELADALARLGRAYLRMGRYDQAEEILHRSLIHYERAGEERRVTLALNALGIVYSNQGRFDEARKHYERCLSIFRMSGYQRGVANMLSNLGSNFGRAGQFAEALSLYHQAYEIAQIVGERLTIAITLSNLGSASRALGQFPRAQRYYEESIDLCRSLGERRWTAASLNGLALTYIEQGELELAYTCAHEALAIAQAIDSIPDQLDSLACLGEVLAENGDAARAYSVLYFIAHHAVTQSATRRRAQHLCDKLSTILSAGAEAMARNRLQQLTLPDLADWASVRADFVTSPATPIPSLRR